MPRLTCRAPPRRGIGGRSPWQYAPSHSDSRPRPRTNTRPGRSTARSSAARTGFRRSAGCAARRWRSKADLLDLDLGDARADLVRQLDIGAIDGERAGQLRPRSAAVHRQIAADRGVGLVALHQTGAGQHQAELEPGTRRRARCRRSPGRSARPVPPSVAEKPSMVTALLRVARARRVRSCSTVPVVPLA